MQIIVNKELPDKIDFNAKNSILVIKGQPRKCFRCGARYHSKKHCAEILTNGTINNIQENNCEPQNSTEQNILKTLKHLKLRKKN